MSQRRLPAEIYWRRRLVALAVVIALVWLVLQVTGGGDEDATSPTPSAATTAPVPVAPTAKTNGVVDVALVSSSSPCDPEKVRVTPSVRPGQVTNGPVDIGLVVSSTSKKACTLTPDDAELLAVIGANGTPVWDSTVCKASILADPVAISPQWASFVTVDWTGRGSGNSCSSKEGYATPGRYTVQIGTLGGEPGRTSFTLDAKPTPKPAKSSPTPKPPKGTTKPAD